MNRIHPNSVKPIARPAGWRDKKPTPEPASAWIEQRHWVKIFTVGLITLFFGMQEFLVKRAEVPNIFNDPQFASYWVLIGMVIVGAGLLVRVWGTR